MIDMLADISTSIVASLLWYVQSWADTVGMRRRNITMKESFLMFIVGPGLIKGFVSPCNIITMATLPRDFYARDAETVARELLGKVLVRKSGKENMAGRIVETEAYYGRRDPASRAYRGKTKLSEPMWSGPGTVFIYMVHNNWLMNIVTGKEGEPAAVLIRALEPLDGFSKMVSNRKLKHGARFRDLASGPGKLTKAMGIAKEHSGMMVSDSRSEIRVVDDGFSGFRLSLSHRIGVSKDLKRKLRFLVKGSRFVSKKA
jgi:DNA-3-methyladenine glycosylase